jgi:hypothetical protein
LSGTKKNRLRRRQATAVLASALCALALSAGASARQTGADGGKKDCTKEPCFEVRRVADCRGANCLEAVPAEGCDAPPCFALRQVAECKGDRCFQVFQTPGGAGTGGNIVGAGPILGVHNRPNKPKPMPAVGAVEKVDRCKTGTCFEVKQVKDCKVPPCFETIRKDTCEGRGCFALKKL